MKIQILGTGCSRCKQLEENTRKAATELGLTFEIEKVTDIQKIVSFGVMTPPAIMVDGKILSAGQLPSPAEIKKLLAAV